MRTRSPRTPRTPVIALLLALLLAAGSLAGCGDDDSGGSGDDGGGDGDALVDDRSEAEVQDDIELAEGVVLTEDDLPDGWAAADEDEEETDEAEDAEEDALDAELYECVGVEDREVIDNERALVSSPEIAREEADVTSEVNVFPSEEYAEAAYAPFEDPDFERCFREIALRSIEQDAAADETGVEFGEATLELVDVPDIGDEATGFQLVLHASYLGTEIVSYANFVAVRVGRIGISLEFTNLGAPFDEDLAQKLTEAVVERAEDAA